MVRGWKSLTACAIQLYPGYARQSEHYVDSSFAGSLPSFLAAFTSRKKLTGKEIAELKKLINNNNNNSK